MAPINYKFRWWLGADRRPIIIGTNGCLVYWRINTSPGFDYLIPVKQSTENFVSASNTNTQIKIITCQDFFSLARISFPEQLLYLKCSYISYQHPTGVSHPHIVINQHSSRTVLQLHVKKIKNIITNCFKQSSAYPTHTAHCRGWFYTFFVGKLFK